MEKAILLLAEKWIRMASADQVISDTDKEQNARLEERAQMYKRCARYLKDLVRLLGNEETK